ncbi:MAG TPA: FtsX-like permease family protein, partial [Chitinophagaceae bacterium]|nr:FtsX-like permease family protein [Chitinophagaceae bacterium]
LAEFLTESIILCLLGGFIGIFLVVILSYVLSGKFDFPVTMSFFNFLLGMGISAIVGVLAGFIPARKASRLDPVVAIRS